MIEWRKIIPAVLAALVLVGTGYADLMPMSPAEVTSEGTLPTDLPPVLQDSKGGGLFHSPGILGLDSPGVGLPSPVEAGAGGASETQALGVFSREPQSRDLCLYALMGLGLCKSAPWVRKLSFGVIPGWYHDGGPFQVGHSHAISADCLCSALGYCFIQPDRRAEDPTPLHRRGMVVAPRRKSQFTRTGLASRGPPHLIHG
jgi:hypothetical protein